MDATDGLTRRDFEKEALILQRVAGLAQVIECVNAARKALVTIPVVYDDGDELFDLDDALVQVLRKALVVVSDHRNLDYTHTTR